MSSHAISRLHQLNKHFRPTADSSNRGGSGDSGGGVVKLAPHVSEALSRGHAVVALESTIISHGMPYPQNLETAKEVEAIVKKNGAIPATVAVINGTPCIGLNGEELELLAKLGPRAQKTARRDIAHVVMGMACYWCLPWRG